MPWYRYLAFIWTWPYDLVLWAAWVVMYALWGENLRWEETSLVFNLRENSWPARTWYKKWGGTTLGHSIFYNSHVKADFKGRPHYIQIHEHFHVVQFESSMLSSFIAGAVVLFICGATGAWDTGAAAGLVVWLSGFLMRGLGAWCTASISGGDFYRDSEHEQAAYAVSDLYQLRNKLNDMRDE